MSTNILELTDIDKTVIRIDRLDAISKKPKTDHNVIQLYFQKREGVMNVYYATHEQAMVDHKRILDGMIDAIH